MNTVLKRTLSSKVFNSLIYRFIRFYSSTFRLSVVNEEKWLSHLENGGRVLLCTWHQQFFSAIRYFKKFKEYRPALMISKSADGDLIANVAGRTGWRPARGSSSSGGKSAMKQIIEFIEKTGLAAHIVDGPRGPMGKVKAGLIRIALEAEAAIVPFYITADRAWYFNSWDRFCVPKPFAKVTLRYGEMITVSHTGTETDFEAERRKVEDIMSPEIIGLYTETG